jgi:hypothetical protein
MAGAGAELQRLQLNKNTEILQLSLRNTGSVITIILYENVLFSPYVVVNILW